MSLASKLFGWIVKGSVKNAGNPHPTVTPINPNVGSGYSDQAEVLEVSVKQDLIIGTNLSLGQEDRAIYGPTGELITSNKNISILCGCGHIVSQLQPTQERDQAPARGIAGTCFYCEMAFKQLVKNGQIAEPEAERLSLVCSDCAKITTSGNLCCPKHYIAIVDESGNAIYLGPEDQAKQQQLVQQQAREDTVKNFFGIFTPQKLDGDHEK